MAENISEITVDLENEGEVMVEQLDKVVLTKGVWSTIIFRYRERDRKTNQFGPAKATLRRYQKFKGVYRKRDAVNLTMDSAKNLIQTLTEWIDKGLLGAAASEPDNAEGDNE
ncbi:MAG: hypothetical protein LBT38_10115 [Deltaproteobacteria bacterium]|jgi:hypothetical protein|nr:hypothetical protein [Deltaproteobacteria bacterium]